jgi:hypothetical protein
VDQVAAAGTSVSSRFALWSARSGVLDASTAWM